MQQRRRVGEVEDPGAAGGDGDQQPGGPLDRAQADLRRRPGRVPELDPGVAVALDPALDQDEEVGPDRLRAGVAAPDPAERRGEEEEAEPGHDQQAGDEVELLRPDLDEEEVEAAVGQVDQHRLVRQRRAAVPADPGGDVVDAERDRHDPPLQRAEASRTRRGKDRLGAANSGGGSVVVWLKGRVPGLRPQVTPASRRWRPAFRPAAAIASRLADAAGGRGGGARRRRP